MPNTIKQVRRHYIITNVFIPYMVESHLSETLAYDHYSLLRQVFLIATNLQ